MVIVQSTYTPFGGVERVALSVINGLLQKGTRVVLLTLPGQKWPVASSNLTIVPMGIQRGHRLIKAWAFNRSVNRFLSTDSGSTILSFDKVTTYTHLHAGGGTHKTFLRIRSEYSNTISNFFRTISPFHRYFLFLERKGFENPKLLKVRCNSNMVREDIRREYGLSEDKMILIHSGIRWQEMADTFLQKDAVARELRVLHQLDPQWNCLLFLGSGFDRKGLDVAIKGLSKMPTQFHLLVVGSGATDGYMRLARGWRVENRVHFLGPKSDGWQYAALCSALVLPSRYDPFGGASAEGHAMGIPVLISDKTGYSDFVRHGENGVILKTPMNDAHIEIAFKELAELIENPKWTPAQIREHARQVDDDVILEKLLEDFIS